MSKIKTKKLIEEIKLLSAEERAMVADSVLKSLSPINTQTEQQWIEVAERRLKDLQEGKVKGVPGDEVFKKLQINSSK